MAVADLCSRFLPGMVERRRGAVLNVASTGAFQPLPGQAGYGAAKAFVLSYTEGLSGELRGTGVTASVLCPGPVDTGFGERAGFSKEDAESALPRFMWETVETVAKVGIDALDRGRSSRARNHRGQRVRPHAAPPPRLFRWRDAARPDGIDVG